MRFCVKFMKLKIIGVDKESGVPLGRATSYLDDSSGVKSQAHVFRQQTVGQFAHLKEH